MIYISYSSTKNTNTLTVLLFLLTLSLIYIYIGPGTPEVTNFNERRRLEAGGWGEIMITRLLLSGGPSRLHTYT